MDQAVKPFFSIIARVKNSSSLQVTIFEDIASILLESFFPPHPPCSLPIADSSSPKTSYTRQLPSILLILEEVHAAIFKVFLFKRLSKNGLLVLV